MDAKSSRVEPALEPGRRASGQRRAANARARNLSGFLRAVGEPQSSGFAAAIARHSLEILDSWLASPVLARSREPHGDPHRECAAALLASFVLMLSTRGGDRLEAAERHADARREAGYTLEEVLAEYADLRANIMRTCAITGRVDLRGLLAFNAAVDAAIARCARRYEMQTKAANDLFLGILAHDIRNPLATILGRTELALLTGQLAPARGMPVINAARRIQGIVEQTVDFTRLQSFGSLPVVRKFADLGVVLAKVVEETQLRVPGAKIVLEAEGDLWGCWDAGRLAQVLSNLLANAITYGSRESPVAARLLADGADVLVSVHNHGAAIPPEEMARIFDPLFRGGGAERRAREGLGLGLYICREIVRSHGGRLWVESDQHAGTTFTARLPREAPLAAAEGQLPGHGAVRADPISLRYDALSTE